MFKRSRTVIRSALIWSLIGGSSATAADDKLQHAALPAMRHYEAPIFPLALRATPVFQGQATVAYTIDDDGRVIDAIAVAATHPAFGEAVIKAMPSWAFEPAAATSIPRRELTDFVFERKAVTALSHFDSTKAAFSPTLDNAGPIETVLWDELDTKPQRVATAMPIYPADAKAKRVAGKATVSFIIDEQGAVRVPTTISDTDADFARAALNAVKQWRFTPPVHNGHPTQVEVVRTFTFGK